MTPVAHSWVTGGQAIMRNQYYICRVQGTLETCTSITERALKLEPHSKSDPKMLCNADTATGLWPDTQEPVMWHKAEWTLKTECLTKGTRQKSVENWGEGPDWVIFLTGSLIQGKFIFVFYRLLLFVPCKCVLMFILEISFIFRIIKVTIWLCYITHVNWWSVENTIHLFKSII